MAPRKTHNIVVAETLLAILRVSPSQAVICETCAEPDAVRQAMYRRMTNEEKKRIVIQKNGYELVISKRKEPKSIKIISLLKEALHHIDDENLYDRIMEALYGTQIAQK